MCFNHFSVHFGININDKPLAFGFLLVWGQETFALHGLVIDQNELLKFKWPFLGHLSYQKLKINPHSSPQNHSYYLFIVFETSYLQNSCDCHYETIWVGDSNPHPPISPKKKLTGRNNLKCQIALSRNIIFLPFENGLIGLRRAVLSYIQGPRMFHFAWFSHAVWSADVVTLILICPTS